MNRSENHGAKHTESPDYGNMGTCPREKIVVRRIVPFAWRKIHRESPSFKEQKALEWRTPRLLRRLSPFSIKNYGASVQRFGRIFRHESPLTGPNPSRCSQFTQISWEEALILSGFYRQHRCEYPDIHTHLCRLTKNAPFRSDRNGAFEKSLRWKLRRLLDCLISDRRLPDKRRDR